MRKAVRWFVKQAVESAVVMALLAAVLFPVALGGCDDDKKKDAKDAGNGWIVVDQTPIGEQIWKKRFEAEKMTIYAYGHYTITVVKDAP